MRKTSEIGLLVQRLIFLGALGLAGCQTEPPANPAESFIDAFYTFDAGQVSATLAAGEEEHDRALYYQAWAKAANYQIQTRRPCTLAEEIYTCKITVTDDFGGALGYTATDTFELRMKAGEIVGVTFSGDDPPIFNALFEWMGANRPEVLTGPCLDMFAGGTTPGACARAVVEAARVFMQSQTKN